MIKFLYTRTYCAHFIKKKERCRSICNMRLLRPPSCWQVVHRTRLDAITGRVRCNYSSTMEVAEEDRIMPPKDPKYYTELADQRKYFYILDTRGQIFLEETMPRNIATSMKDAKFVNFMYRTLRPNQTGQFEDSHPFVSYCGKEVNYVSPVDRYSPFCFKDLLGRKSDGALSSVANIIDFCNDSTENMKLLHGFDFLHPFEISSLFYHPVSGRIYHKILQHKYLQGHIGLLHPFLAQKLASQMKWDDEQNGYCIEWLGRQYKLETPQLSAVTTTLS